MCCHFIILILTRTGLHSIKWRLLFFPIEARKSIFFSQQIFWTHCVFLSSLWTILISCYLFRVSNYLLVAWIIFVVIVRINFSFILRIIFQCYCELLFQCVLRIIFSLGQELIFAASRIYFLSYNTLQSLRSTLKTLPAEESLQREFQGETLSGKETKEVFIFSYKIWKESLVLRKSDEVFWTEETTPSDFKTRLYTYP